MNNLHTLLTQNNNSILITLSQISNFSASHQDQNFIKILEIIYELKHESGRTRHPYKVPFVQRTPDQ